MKKVVLTYGIIAGIIVAIMMFITMPMAENGDSAMGMVMGYATMIIALSMIFVGTKMYRDKYNGGEIKFGRAFLVGLYISLIASCIYAIAWELYLKTSGLGAVGFMEKYMEGNVDKMLANGATTEEVEELKNSIWVKNYRYLAWRFLMTMFEMLPVGLLVSLISAAILKRKKMQPAQEVV